VNNDRWIIWEDLFDHHEWDDAPREAMRDLPEADTVDDGSVAKGFESSRGTPRSWRSWTFNFAFHHVSLPSGLLDYSNKKG